MSNSNHREIGNKALFKEQRIQDKWSVNPMSVRGGIVRPYYTPLPDDWHERIPTSTKDNEKSIKLFLQEKPINDFIKQWEEPVYEQEISWMPFNQPIDLKKS